MRSYLLTMRYRMPSAVGRLDAEALASALGRGYVARVRPGALLDVVGPEAARSPSQAAAVAHRRLVDLWPQVWSGRGLRSAGTPEETLTLTSVTWRSASGDSRASTPREPRRATPPPALLRRDVVLPPAARVIR